MLQNIVLLGNLTDQCHQYFAGVSSLDVLKSNRKLSVPLLQHLEGLTPAGNAALDRWTAANESHDAARLR